MLENLHLTYRKGDFQAVIQHNFGAVSPDVIEQVEHDTDSFVPYQPSISLGIALRKWRFNSPLHTSEKAGAAIARYLFHSSPSEAMMLLPNTASTEYR